MTNPINRDVEHFYVNSFKSLNDQISSTETEKQEQVKPKKVTEQLLDLFKKIRP